MNILHETVEIGTKSAKLKENGIDELNMTSDIMNITKETTIKSEVSFWQWYENDGLISKKI